MSEGVVVKEAILAETANSQYKIEPAEHEGRPGFRITKEKGLRISKFERYKVGWTMWGVALYLEIGAPFRLDCGDNEFCSSPVVKVTYVEPQH